MDTSTQTSVQKWFASMETFWEEPLTERERTERLEAIGRFAEAQQSTPDALINDVLSGDEGAASLPRVAHYWKQIRAFGEEHTPAKASLIMSFFIHNGVLMQAPLDA